MNVEVVTQKEVTTRNKVLLTGADIIDILNTRLSETNGPVIPDNAQVTFTTPGGGNWSNMEIDVDKGTPVTISWTTQDVSYDRS
jgi:hypothetical protein